MNLLVPNSAAGAVPRIVVSAGGAATTRFLEFFTVNIRNPNTRRAYAQAAREFLAWLESVGVASIAAVEPVHVAGYIEMLMRERSIPPPSSASRQSGICSTGW